MRWKSEYKCVSIAYSSAWSNAKTHICLHTHTHTHTYLVFHILNNMHKTFDHKISLKFLIVFCSCTVDNVHICLSMYKYILEYQIGIEFNTAILFKILNFTYMQVIKLECGNAITNPIILILIHINI